MVKYAPCLKILEQKHMPWIYNIFDSIGNILIWDSTKNFLNLTLRIYIATFLTLHCTSISFWSFWRWFY